MNSADRPENFLTVKIHLDTIVQSNEKNNQVGSVSWNPVNIRTELTSP